MECSKEMIPSRLSVSVVYFMIRGRFWQHFT